MGFASLPAVHINARVRWRGRQTVPKSPRRVNRILLSAAEISPVPMFHGLKPIRGFGGSGGGASSVQIGRQELRMLARNVSPDTVSALKSFLSLTTLSLSELTAEHSICNGEFSRPVSCYRKTPLSMKYLPRRKSNWSRSDFHQVITHVRWNKFPSRAARCSRRQ
jgi:hypothetical protein